MVAAQANAAEGEGAAGAGSGAIPVDDAGADFVAEFFVEGGVVAEQAGGEAEGGVVGFGDGGVEIFDADDLEQGAEIFFVQTDFGLW